MKKENDNFIMLPTVDICFKGLMNNPKVRKGFIASLLKTDPETIRETRLLPTELRQEYPDDKLGILDVRVMMEDQRQIDMEMQVAYFEYWDARSLFYLSKIFTDQLKKGEPYENLKQCIHVSILDFICFKNDEKCYRTICFCDEKTGEKYTDLMEMQVLELKKLPEKAKNGEDIIKWMHFLGGKNRKEFEDMAKTDEYIEEAYKELEKLSADERAKLEYEARERAIRDFNSQMSSALKRGTQKGIEQGLQQGLQQGKALGEQSKLRELTERKLNKGMSIEAIADLLEEDTETIRSLAEEIQKEQQAVALNSGGNTESEITGSAKRHIPGL